MVRLSVFLYIWILIRVLIIVGAEMNSVINDRQHVGIEMTTQTRHVIKNTDDSSIWHIFTEWLRSLFRSWGGETGLRNSGTFLQKRTNTPFPCRRYMQRSVIVPDNVHQLRPGDVDVVAAIGGSMTAAVGANAISTFESAVENRGLSFSIGGQGNFRTHLTIPNILKEFNPRLIGFSRGDSASEDRAAQFNLAENVATIGDLPFMAYKLLRRMRLDRRVDMNKHWKLVTITVGRKDFCQNMCYQKTSLTVIAQRQEENIVKTLRIIRDTMPRTFVNLVAEPLFDVIVSMNGLNLPFPCVVGRALGCPCLATSLFSKSRELYMILEQNYNEFIQRVARNAEFQREDFTVVFQPFGMNGTVFLDSFSPDISIMAYDCVNFSQKGHAVAANALWNNMLQPESRKEIGLKPLFESFECPSKDNPYLRTYFNSIQEFPVRVW